MALYAAITAADSWNLGISWGMCSKYCDRCVAWRHPMFGENHVWFVFLHEHELMRLMHATAESI